VAEPVASGIVARLDRPGGNVTGFANHEPSLAGKWLELLSEIAPGLKRAAIMFNAYTAPHQCSTRNSTRCTGESVRRFPSGCNASPPRRHHHRLQPTIISAF
jgi:hypothetical protein